MEIGRVKWLAPTGVVGITPLASVGPVSLGSSSREGSSAEMSEVIVKLHPLQSLLQRKIVLQFQAKHAQVKPSPAYSESSLWQYTLYTMVEVGLHMALTSEARDKLDCLL